MPPAAVAALLTGLVLATVNILHGLNLPFVVSDSWVKLVHYSLRFVDLRTLAAAWGGHAWSAAGAALVLGGCQGFGSVVNRRRPVSDDGGGMLVSLGLGLGGGALLALGLGLCGLFTPVTVVPVLLAGLARAVRRRAELAAAGGRIAELVGPLAGETVWLIAALFLMGGVSLLVSLGPEMGWDPAYYHLRLPKLYAMAHRISFVPCIYPSHYPQTVELVYGLAWLAGGEGAAKLVNWSFWGLCGVALLRLAPVPGGRVGLRGAALALCLPLAGTLASESYIDLGLTFFELLALSAALSGRPVTAGCLIGFAMGSKYTAVVAAFALAAAWIARGGRMRGLVVLAAVSALPVAPWLAKNWLYTGDPVAPFLYRAFGGLEWAGGISQAAMVEVIPKLQPGSWAARGTALLLGPWWFLKTFSFAVLTPFVIGALPVLAMRWTGTAGAIRAYVVAGTGALLVLAPDGRYWQPFGFAFAILAAAAWRRFELEGRGILRRGIAAVAWFSIGFGPVFHAFDMHRLFTPCWVALGLEPAWVYHSRVNQPSPWYAVAVTWANRNAPPRGRIAVVSDVQAYLFDRETIFDCDAPGSRRWITRLLERRRGEAALDRQFRQWNVRTVFYIRGKAMAASRGETWEPGAAARMAAWWNRRAHRVFYRGHCSIYELARPGQARLQLDLPGPQEAYLMRVVAAPDLAARRAVWRAALAAGAESAVLDGAFGESALEGNPPAAAEAAGALARAVAIAPDAGGLWISYGRALTGAGRLAAARAALAKARELNPLHDDLEGAEADLARAEGGKR